MQEFTILEKRIIFQTLVLIMRADSILNPAETEYLNKIFHDFELDISEFDHLEMIDFDYLSNEFAKFSAEKKTYAMNLFVEMSECDGCVDPREVVMIKSITEKKVLSNSTQGVAIL
ncbi:MAG: hypothetical protein IJP75_01690 [Bacteroidaceae bacterium]|nr:hypothetical protein [Bacteroidaceae bacterium]